MASRDSGKSSMYFVVVYHNVTEVFRTFQKLSWNKRLGLKTLTAGNIEDWSRSLLLTKY